jgi:hypothetical protein
MVICKVSVPQYTTDLGSEAYLAPMFTREEASLIKQEFWTTFGKYMGPIRSAEGMKINWINYHTGVKNIYFRMDAGQHSAAIYISIQHPDPELQELYFEQFLQLKDLLRATLQEEWDWQLHLPVNGTVVTRIYKEISPVSIFNSDQWPELISFFKQRIIALDSFWEDAKYSFQALN